MIYLACFISFAIGVIATLAYGYLVYKNTADRTFALEKVTMVDYVDGYMYGTRKGTLVLLKGVDPLDRDVGMVLFRNDELNACLFFGDFTAAKRKFSQYKKESS